MSERLTSARNVKRFHGCYKLRNEMSTNKQIQENIEQRAFLEFITGNTSLDMGPISHTNTYKHVTFGSFLTFFKFNSEDSHLF